MIPPRVLKKLAERLIKETQSGATNWSRSAGDVQRYVSSLASGQMVVHFIPSRGSADTIEFAIIDTAGNVIGSVVAQEDEPSYEVLADLLFEIQLKKEPGMHGGVTDEILRLLNQ